jgi:hypothetical protein
MKSVKPDALDARKPAHASVEAAGIRVGLPAI